MLLLSIVEYSNTLKNSLMLIGDLVCLFLLSWLVAHFHFGIWRRTEHEILCTLSIFSGIFLTIGINEHQTIFQPMSDKCAGGCVRMVPGMWPPLGGRTWARRLTAAVPAWPACPACPASRGAAWAAAGQRAASSTSGNTSTRRAASISDPVHSDTDGPDGRTRPHSERPATLRHGSRDTGRPAPAPPPPSAGQD